MKNRVLALAMFFLMVNAAATAFACQCAFADRREPFKAGGAETAQCHHESAAAKGQDAGGKCCGRCRFEKAAAVSEKPVYFVNTRSPEAAGAIMPSEEPVHNPRGLFRDCAGFYGSSRSFFVLHTLGTSFSFRAPPRG